MSKLANRDWADDEEFDDASALPAQTVTTNRDGTKTVISYSLNEQGKKVKTTRRTRTRVVRETVNPRVAERREWAKFGLEKDHAKGPSSETTTVGENILFRPSATWRADGRDEAKKAEEDNMKDKLRDKKVTCRICSGDHFTARCPFKDTMAPAGEAEGTATGATLANLREDEEGKLGGGGGKGGSYVPPALRGAGGGAGERMTTGRERDDLATLRITNVSEMAEEQDLRTIFERFGRVTRVFLAKDRETGRAKGFAFISFADRIDAQRACEKLDGYLYEYLVLKVEFAKRANT